MIIVSGFFFMSVKDGTPTLLIIAAIYQMLCARLYLI